ncbi:MAG: VanZ family protein [Clostridia bacterium]
MKINIERIILIILLLCTFRIIFGFSSQNSTESSGVSRKITIMITKNIKAINNKPEAEKENIIHKVETVIRKIAHFSIYTVVRFAFNGINFYIQFERTK